MRSEPKPFRSQSVDEKFRARLPRRDDRQAVTGVQSDTVVLRHLVVNLGKRDHCRDETGIVLKFLLVCGHLREKDARDVDEREE